MNILSDGTTGNVLSTYGGSVFSGGIPILPASSFFFTEYVQQIAIRHLRWRLRAMELEIVPVNTAATATFTLGITNDPAVSFISPPTAQQLADLQCARVFNLGFTQAQRLIFRPPVRNEWKYVSQDSQTSAPDTRQVAAGELWGVWNISIPSAQRFADVYVHFDLEFKDPVNNQNVTLSKEAESKIKQPVTGPEPTIFMPRDVVVVQREVDTPVNRVVQTIRASSQPPGRR